MVLLLYFGVSRKHISEIIMEVKGKRTQLNTCFLSLHAAIWGLPEIHKVRSGFTEFTRSSSEEFLN